MVIHLYKYSILTSFVSFLLYFWGGGKIIIPYYLFVSKTVGLMDIGLHFESFTVGNRDLGDRYGIFVSYMTADVFHLS